MSRPHGAANTRTEDRIVKQAPCFPDARRALVDVLESFCFVKVVSVTGSGSGSYHGEAVETSFRDAREKPKLLFFDKFGRTKGLMRIGPIQVAQAPLGPDHASSVPSPGDFLFGSAVPNTRKGPQDHVLRGWSSDAKPMWELLRILKFGTRSTEFECRSLLVQPCSSLLQASGLHKSVRDDIYMTARVILWKSLRPLQVLASLQSHGPNKFELLEAASDAEKLQARGIKLSSTATDFIDAITLKFNDSNISETFMTGFKPCEPEEYDPEKQSSAYGSANSSDYASQYASQYAPVGQMGPMAPMAAPMSVLTQFVQQCAAAVPPSAAAAAPSAAATSAAVPPAPPQQYAPPYAPPYQIPAPTSSTWLRDRLQSMLKSPAASAATEYMPKSPVVPTSPAYAPSSPMYAPTSPMSDI